MRADSMLRVIIATTLILSVALVVALQAPQAAGASSGKVNVPQVCSDNSDFGLTRGGCVALVQSHNQRTSADLAAICMAIVAGTDYYENRGECVNDLNSYYVALYAPEATGASSGAVDVVRVCSDNSDFGLTRGGCVALVRSHNQRTSADLAAICMAIVAGTDYYENRGECLNELNTYYS